MIVYFFIATYRQFCDCLAWHGMVNAYFTMTNTINNADLMCTMN